MSAANSSTFENISTSHVLWFPACVDLIDWKPYAIHRKNPPGACFTLLDRVISMAHAARGHQWRRSHWELGNEFEIEQNQVDAKLVTI